MIGETISHFRVLRLLGRGAMGDVYLARDLRLERDVALKFLASDLARDPAAVRRLDHEARAAAGLSHPNIAGIHEFVETDGQRFLVLEYVEGATLDEKLEAGPLPVKDALRIAVELARGLAHAHGRRIVHRDLKPANIMITPEGTPRILDFGLARSADMTRLTGEGQHVGTPRYMSPEQVEGKDADGRTDLWSLGAILYECLTGRPAFVGDSVLSVMHQVVQERPDPPSAIRPGLLPVVDRLVMRCLEKDPARRYASADELRSDLENVLAGRETAGATLPLGKPDRAPRFRRGLLSVAGAVVVVAAVAGVWLKTRPGHEDDELSRTPPPPPSWILVADFETTPPDTQLAEAARELTVSALAQSGFVTPLSRDQLRQGLELAGKPPGSRIAGDLAHELAYRASAKAYVEGRVDRVLSGYSVVLNVLDTESRVIVSSVSGTAANQETLISTLDELGRGLRRALGEKESSIRSDRPLREVATPSFEAYKLYLEALNFHDQGQYDRAIARCREAVALDPEFAMAWSQMSICFANLAEPDSTREAMEMARSFPQRLTEFDRLNLEAQWSFVVEGNLEAALVGYERLRDRFPARANYNNLALVLAALGQHKNALAVFEESRTQAPLGRHQILVHNQFLHLMGDHDFRAARELIPELTGRHWSQTRANMVLALGEGDWNAAALRAEELLRESGADPFNRDLARATQALLEALRGRTGGAMDSLASMCEDEVSRERIPLSRVLQSEIRIAQGRIPEFPVLSLDYDTTPVAFNWRMIWTAEHGNTARTESLLAETSEFPRDYRRRYADTIVYSRAWVHAHRGEWESVIGLLDSPAYLDVRPGATGNVGPTPIQWLLGLALEETGDHAGAARAFEMVRTAEGCQPWLSWVQRTAYYPHALRKLVLIYSRLGREDEARARWRELQETVTDPDEEMRPLLEEARAAVTAL